VIDACCTHSNIINYGVTVLNFTKIISTSSNISEKCKPIGIIFGTVQQCFVLNTFEHAISNKFVTQLIQVVRYLAIRSTTQFFTWKLTRDQCMTDAHRFKIPAPIAQYARYFTFVNWLIQSDAIATWRKTLTGYSIIKNIKNATSLTFLASWISPNVTKWFHEHRCIG